MKICLINNLYKPYARGGAERVVELTAGGLKRAGHEVVIISLRPWRAKAAGEDDRASGIRIYRLRGFYQDLSRIPRPLRFFWHIMDMFDVGSYFIVKKILVKERPDRVITHNLAGVGYLVPPAVKSAGIAQAHVLHDMQLLHPSGLMIYGRERVMDGPAAKAYRGLCRRLFSAVPAVISPSRWLLDEHVRRGFFRGAAKIVLPNPAPAPGTPPPAVKTDGGPIRLLYVGQVEKHKGILFLIRALGALKDDRSFPAWKLTVVGSGTELERAREEARGRGDIEFTGPLSPESVGTLMRRSGCLIVPSLCYENSPAVIYEAAALGLPVVAARLGGIPELVRAAGGILFEPGDREDLAEKIKTAVKNPRGSAGTGGGRLFGGIEEYIEKLLRALP